MGIKSGFLLVVCCLFGGNVVAKDAIDQRYQKNYDYALKASYESGCVLDNGYVCSEAKKSNAVASGIAGVYVPALTVAYEAFKQIPDLSDEQKRLEHYKVFIGENDSELIVGFGALLLPDIKDGKPDGIILMSIGLSTTFWIDKSTLKINKRLFSKN